MIPQELKGFETYIVCYSTGKDSMATYLWALENLPPERVQAVFCATGGQWPEVYGYLAYTEEELGVTIKVLTAGDRPFLPKRNGKPRYDWEMATNLRDMIALRGKWPGVKARYCTAYLKRWPITLFARECHRPVLLFGQRAEESQRRSKMASYDPTGDKGGIPIYRPILQWREMQVWDYLKYYAIKPNPVYNYATRVSCWCCIMARNSDVFNFCRLHPDIAQWYADLEHQIGHSWKPNQSIGNLLRRARAQQTLLESEPRFAEALEM